MENTGQLKTTPIIYRWFYNIEAIDGWQLVARLGNLTSERG